MLLQAVGKFLLDPTYLKGSKPNGLVVWENVWEQGGEGGRLMAEGLCSGHS